MLISIAQKLNFSIIHEEQREIPSRFLRKPTSIFSIENILKKLIYE